MKKTAASILTALLATAAFAATITQGTITSVAPGPVFGVNVDRGPPLGVVNLRISADQYDMLVNRVGKSFISVDMDDDGDLRDTSDYAKSGPYKVHGDGQGQ